MTREGWDILFRLLATWETAEVDKIIMPMHCVYEPLKRDLEQMEYLGWQIQAIKKEGKFDMYHFQYKYGLKISKGGIYYDPKS